MSQLRSVVVWLLIVACVVAAVTADTADVIAIAGVLAINIALGFAVELRANRAVEALVRLQPHGAVGLRDGVPVDLDAATLVPGDVILLEPGQTVPADARLIETTELRTVEALLTGESLPVWKDAAAIVESEASVAERQNMVYAGTTVAAGVGRAAVAATASATQLGLIGQLVTATTASRTPLEESLDALGRRLVWIALLIGSISGAVGALHGAAAGELLEGAIALAVAAVPEGLPAVATLALAFGVHRMAERHAIIRRLPLVETLGSVTVLCTDKTGTLTAGAMQVTRVETGSLSCLVSGDGYAPVGEFRTHEGAIDPLSWPELDAALRIAMVANDGDVVRAGDEWVARGDPTDAALIAAARKAGMDRATIVAHEREISRLPFSSERRLTARIHGVDGQRELRAYVKGSPERVLALCSREQIDGRPQWLDDAAQERWRRRNRDMAAEGLRVLGVAWGTIGEAQASALNDLTFVALVGMTDPPARGVPETVEAFDRAGIRTVMITGDQPGTAGAVARALRLQTPDQVLDGREVDGMPDAELGSRIRSTNVFSRVSPEGKLRIVTAFQRAGHVVAMIGDGVNDAAALKKADVGVTMGRRGTDVARETAAVVLEDDRFETIGVAIREGRVIYDNITKFVFYLFSCNLAEVLVILVATASSIGVPLAPIHILWMNLVTDTLPALALALEPGEAEVMRRRPRDPAQGLLSRAFLTRVFAYAALIAISVFGCIVWTVVADIPRDRAMTMNFMALSLAQVFHLGNARSNQTVLTPASAVANPWALAAVALVLALQGATVWVAPLARLVRVTPLAPEEWLVVLAASSVPAVVGQAWKARRGAINRRRPRSTCT